MKIGPYELKRLPDGVFRLDGGAMYGVVPKVLWSRNAPADDLNRIAFAQNLEADVVFSEELLRSLELDHRRRAVVDLDNDVVRLEAGFFGERSDEDLVDTDLLGVVVVAG